MRSILILILLAVTGAASPHDAYANGWRSDEAFWLQLDDHVYALPAGSLVFSSNGHVTLQSPLALAQCQRRQGGAWVSSAYRLIYDSVGRSLYLSSPVFSVTGKVLRLQSSSGDLICAGASPASAVFGDSFE